MVESAALSAAEAEEAALEFRNDRLRCLGNAVVPQQAALAIRVLVRDLHKRLEGLKRVERAQREGSKT